MYPGTGKACEYALLSTSQNDTFLIVKVNLGTLDLANNQIKKLENVSHLEKLEEFWVRNWLINPSLPCTITILSQFNHNQVEDWHALKELASAKGLRTVYFEGNPIASDPQYRRKLQLELSTLVQIDATLVRRT